MKKLLMTLFFCSVVLPANTEEMKTVQDLNLNQYGGTWYEWASYPNIFQNKDCVGTTATYTRWPNGKIRVYNQCYLPKSNTVERVEGKAWVPNPAEPAKLKVSFGGPLAGDYWVLDVGDAYEYAVVGSPSRDYLWILSRTPELAPNTLKHIYEVVQSHGYDLNRLRKTPLRSEYAS